MGINIKRKISSLVPGENVRSQIQNALTVEWAGHKTVLVDVPTSARSNDFELASSKGYGRLADDDEDVPRYRDSVVDVRELYDGYGMGFDSERQRHSAYDLAALRDAHKDGWVAGSSSGSGRVKAGRREKVERTRAREEIPRERELREEQFVRPRMKRSSTAPNEVKFRSNNPFAHPFDHGLDEAALERKPKALPPAPAWPWDSEPSSASSSSSTRHR